MPSSPAGQDRTAVGTELHGVHALLILMQKGSGKGFTGCDVPDPRVPSPLHVANCRPSGLNSTD